MKKKTNNCRLDVHWLGKEIVGDEKQWNWNSPRAKRRIPHSVEEGMEEVFISIKSHSAR